MLNVLLIIVGVICIMAIVVLMPVFLYLFCIGFSVFELFSILSHPINAFAAYGLCIFTVLLLSSIAGTAITYIKYCVRENKTIKEYCLDSLKMWIN